MSAITHEGEHAVTSPCTYWDGLSGESLKAVLAVPANQCIEKELADCCKAEEFGYWTTSRLSLTLTTRTAYRLPVVRVFVGALAGRMSLNEELQERIHTAVQEALMNAVLHGNLKIVASRRHDLAGLLALHESIDSLLADDEVARRVVDIRAVWSGTRLHVVVRDSGDGFELSELPSSVARDVDDAIASGRGLRILGAMCDRFTLLRGGQAVKMSFEL
ncbi:ATP-binding protein [Bradyrhizobium sp.]|uniref:ATP-binding protein n=1 Tax=Bradyrhizobium sp. TaxID=376 RepID=UPI003C5FE7CD